MSKETTFENAKEGDRVYSPLLKIKNPYDKTNGTIINIHEGYLYKIEVMSEVDFRRISFGVEGNFFEGGGQVLFWENPIKEIPVKPKMKVTKKGWIGICKHEGLIKNCKANTTYIYFCEEQLSEVRDRYTVQQIEYVVEE